MFDGLRSEIHTQFQLNPLAQKELTSDKKTQGFFHAVKLEIEHACETATSGAALHRSLLALAAKTAPLMEKHACRFADDAADPHLEGLAHLQNTLALALEKSSTLSEAEAKEANHNWKGLNPMIREFEQKAVELLDGEFETWRPTMRDDFYTLCSNLSSRALTLGSHFHDDRTQDRIAALQDTFKAVLDKITSQKSDVEDRLADPSLTSSERISFTTDRENLSACQMQLTLSISSLEAVDSWKTPSASMSRIALASLPAAPTRAGAGGPPRAESPDIRPASPRAAPARAAPARPASPLGAPPLGAPPLAASPRPAPARAAPPLAASPRPAPARAAPPLAAPPLAASRVPARAAAAPRAVSPGFRPDPVQAAPVRSAFRAAPPLASSRAAPAASAASGAAAAATSGARGAQALTPAEIARLRKVKVGDDGDCLYHSLALLLGNGKSAGQLRAECAAYVASHYETDTSLQALVTGATIDLNEDKQTLAREQKLSLDFLLTEANEALRDLQARGGTRLAIAQQTREIEQLTAQLAKAEATISGAVSIDDRSYLRECSNQGFFAAAPELYAASILYGKNIHVMQGAHEARTFEAPRQPAEHIYCAFAGKHYEPLMP